VVQTEWSGATAVEQRSSRGRRLRGRGTVVSSGGGHGGEGALGGRSERLVHIVALGGQGFGRRPSPRRHLER
jgi:hypothetical protein